MNVKESYCIAHNNIKGRKKTGRILFVIFFVALFIYLLVNSMVYSIDNLVSFIQEIPAAKTLVYRDEDGTMYDKLSETCKDMEDVVTIYPYVKIIVAEVEGMKTDERVVLEIKSFSEDYADYLVEGELPKENEILLPHYMYGSDLEVYEDCSQYIGKTLTLGVTDYNKEEQTIECKVSGTYDNIYSITGNCMGFISPENAIELYNLDMNGIEEELERVIEQNGPGFYGGYEKIYYCAVAVDSIKNIEKVREDINEAIGYKGSIEVDTSRNELKTIFSYIQFIGMIITVILLAIVVVMMVIMIGNDIRGRKKEMAMYFVQGYTRGNLLSILSMEYVMRLVPVLIVSTIVTLITIMLENKVIETVLGVEYQVLQMEFSFMALGAGIGILTIVIGVAVYTISEQVKKIELLKEIKSEG